MELLLREDSTGEQGELGRFAGQKVAPTTLVCGELKNGVTPLEV